MRCSLGKKKIKKLSEKTGLDVVHALTRGGTDHRIDLFVNDGTIWRLYKDGELEKDHANPNFVNSWK